MFLGSCNRFWMGWWIGSIGSLRGVRLFGCCATSSFMQDTCYFAELASLARLGVSCRGYSLQVLIGLNGKGFAFFISEFRGISCFLGIQRVVQCYFNIILVLEQQVVQSPQFSCGEPPLQNARPQLIQDRFQPRKGRLKLQCSPFDLKGGICGIHSRLVRSGPNLVRERCSKQSEGEQSREGSSHVSANKYYNPPKELGRGEPGTSQSPARD